MTEAGNLMHSTRTAMRPELPGKTGWRMLVLKKTTARQPGHSEYMLKHEEDLTYRVKCQKVVGQLE